ncbi:MAG TPA: response regulator [Pirellulaceae bacterium]|nr:response regulator [Pirellulaceae bacterium]
MLVLSRKQNERILFPHLGVTIEVLRVSGNAVRVGIDAPPDVQVLREEVAQRQGLALHPETLQKRRHDLRNRLHTANLALHLLQRQLDAGWYDQAEKSLQLALVELTELNDLVANSDQSASAPAEKRRALLVEDNPNERELLAGILRLSGYEVEVAEDGLAAMRLLEEHAPPDLVLLDMQMPSMDGGQTVSAIRCNPAYRGLKVFAVSGTDRKSLGVELGGRGVDRWFAKPLNPSAFIRELNRELSLPAVGRTTLHGQ